MKKCIIILLMLFATSCSDSIFDMIDSMDNEYNVIFVDSECTATAPDGRTWATAFSSIQEAIDTAEADNQIWVKSGTYDISDTIAIDDTKQSISIYGGFNGTETNINQKENNPDSTILQIINATRLMTISGSKDINIDGFTLTADSVEGRALQISNADSITIINSKFSGLTSSGGAAMHISASSTSINNCTFNDNSSSTDGGSLYITGSAEIEIEDSTFTKSSTTYNGGALYIEDVSTVSITNSTFGGEEAGIENSSRDGGAIYILESTVTIADSNLSGNFTNGSNGGAIYSRDSVLNIDSSNFSYNYTTPQGFYGGAVYLYAGETSITDTKLFNNGYNGSTVYSAYGGAIYLNNDGTLNINGSGTEIYSNCSITNGAGIYVSGSNSSLIISDATISNNGFITEGTPETTFGGGISITNGSTVTINGTTIQNNQVSNGGGGIYVSGADIDINSSILTDNTSNNMGGGIHVVNSSEINIMNCELNDNSTENYGGAIVLSSGSSDVSRIVNTIFNNNITNTGMSHYGGAVYISNPDNKIFVNITFYSNLSTDGGAIYVAQTGTLNVYNTVFYSNTAFGGNGLDVNMYSGSLAMNNCYFQNVYGTSSDTDCINSASNPFESITSTDTDFLYPVDIAGDDCIDTGLDYNTIETNHSFFTRPTTDLAGNTRVVNGTVDMGAYEVQ